MTASRERTGNRRSRPVIGDSELKANEPLIKARFYKWALDAYACEWPSCAREVEHTTGVRIPVETLRQNFRATSAKAKRPPRSFRKIVYLRALYDFTRAQGYLGRYKLARAEGCVEAALSLGDFIGRNHSNLKLSGSYRSERDLGSTIETIELDIVSKAKAAVPRVLVTETIEDPTSEVPIEVLHRHGWLVANDAGMIVLFTRHAQEGAEIYTLLQSVPSPWKSTSPDHIALFRYQGCSTLALRQQTANELPSLVPKNLPERAVLFLTRLR